MKLTYEELISPPDIPIPLSIGRLKQPSLREIWKLGINVYRTYQIYMRMSPNDYYTIIKNGNNVYWNTISDKQKSNTTMFDIIILDNELAMMYKEIFNFFFVERVIFRDNIYMLIDTSDCLTSDDKLEITKDNFVGMIHSGNFNEILDILQQVCCIKSDDPMEEKEPVFKNEKAKRLYERMLQAKKQAEKKGNEKVKRDLSLPNVISTVSARCPGLNIINIWETTLFSLYDQFNKTQNFQVYYVNAIHASVWGDEKNTFDSSLWYKNNYDKSS